MKLELTWSHQLTGALSSRPVWAACAKEPECLFFDVFEDPKTPGKIRFVEIWSKPWEWFGEHSPLAVMTVSG